MGNIVGGSGGGLFSAIGGIVGTIFGGPIGAMIGQMIGGMVDQMFSGAMNNAGVDQDTQSQAQNAYRDAYRQASGGLEPNSPAGSGSIRDQVDQFADATGASAADRGDLQRIADELQQKINDFVAKGAADAAGGQELKESKGGSKGGSWLMAIARALGTVAGDSAKRLVTLSDKVADASKEKNELADDKNASTGEKGAAADKYNQAVTELQGASQEFGLLMNTISTTLKSLGEGLANVARKQ